MKENDEKLREILRNEEVPEQLSPENMKIMLDEKAAKKKRSGISVAGRIAAGAAACAVVVGAYAGTAQMMKSRKDGGKSSEKPKTEYVDAPYMNGAKSYKDVYELMERSAKKWERNQTRTTGGLFGRNKYDYVATESAVTDGAIAEDEYVKESANEMSVAPATGAPEHSDTYNQEEGVIEADIVKTDGENIYYLWNSSENNEYYDEKIGHYYSYYQTFPKLRTASVEDGRFTSAKTLDLTPDLSGFDAGDSCYVTVYDMYIYNDMIEVIGSVNDGGKSYTGSGYYIDDEGAYHAPVSSTFVSVYTTGDEPELIGTYFQDGYYNDVRIALDGCMYLISNYNTVDFNSVKDPENIERYIPCCGMDDEIECIPPEDVLMPTDAPEAKTLLNYMMISGIDLSESGTFSVVDNKALADFSGTIYSSAENIYTAVTNGADSDVTRIAVSGGSITPVASGTVEGYVKDQFSMSEYGGYFRIATTINKYHDNRSFIGDIFGNNELPYTERNNAVTVLDMDMNEVGKIKDFGVDEQIKSVNFSGNMGYVVTFRQTDPLFAIDLSDPTAPVITDEFKINGFSTYMQNWSDGLLLGFGVDADDTGRTSGVKLVMFDNSDPSNLKEVGIERINLPDGYVYSTANAERKAMLIAPEKNLIGFPVTLNNYDEYYERSMYVFYSYDGGEFTKLGEFSLKNDPDAGCYIPDRALYIGDYVYVLSGGQFVSADIATMNVVDEVFFE